MDNNAYQSDIQEDELIRLVSSSSDTSTQYVIFKNITDDIFAINVAKVEELIQNQDLKVSNSIEHDGIVSSIAKIRDEMVTLVDFDKWLDPSYTSSSQTHELIMLCNYAQKRIGIIIKNVVGIQSIEPDEMYPANNKDIKTSYVTELSSVNNTLCNIFNSDQLLLDIYPDMITSEIDDLDDLKDTASTKKLILIAEDSKLVQQPMARMLEKSNYNFEIYNNGKLMLDRLLELDTKDIGLIIADIEMPVMDGMEMLAIIQQNEKYNNLPIIVHTNMANNAIEKRALDLGAVAIARKLDFAQLDKMITQFSVK
jgi:two-component system chemotaxis response regulator CheV